MLMFIVYTVIFWIANIAMAQFLYKAIQQGAMFDVLFGWQKMLAKLYSKGGLRELLGKFLGDCAQCFMHFVSIINFAMYAIVMNKWIGVWIENDSEVWYWVLNVIWYLTYVSIAWWFALSYHLKNNKNEKA